MKVHINNIQLDMKMKIKCLVKYTYPSIEVKKMIIFCTTKETLTMIMDQNFGLL